MATTTDAVWAIDIGNNSLKALRLTERGGAVEVIGFENIQHGKILTGSGLSDSERAELIASSLRQFTSRNSLGKKEDIIISVPSQNSFARFVNLPPVEAKRIPEIVSFEAMQQIPFDINDVQWDWQLMGESVGGENKVGIFAIKNEVVNSMLEHFERENIQVGYVQMAPMALYNYLLHDRPDLTGSDANGTVILNIGAENTDLVVCTKSTVWQRCIPMGGNAFTGAIAEAFKLSFEKAEKLKRTAVMSKYSRQILQAMKPVFTDLASEIQRSLGFYSSSNPNTKLVRIVAFGGGTKMRGLIKYLQQSLQIPIEMLDSFKRLSIGSDVSAAKFHENVCDFGVVYGLGLQALGLGRIESNLLPRSVARSMAWKSKARYFTAAACILLLVSAMCLARVLFDKVSYENKSDIRRRVDVAISNADQAADKLKEQKNRASVSKATIAREFKFFNYRDVIPQLHQSLILALPNEKNNPEQKELYAAFADGDVETVLKTPRKERKQVFVTSVSVQFADDVSTASFSDAESRKRATRSSGGRKKRRSKKDKAALMEMLGLGSRVPSRSTRRTPSVSTRKPKTGKEQEVKSGPGFVVTIEGYSTYRAIGELLEPVDTERDPNNWGIVNRLLHLDDIVDGNSPFVLFRKADIDHFILETGPVDMDSDTPEGIGQVEARESKSINLTSPAEILVDPTTKEVISRVAVLNKDGSEKIDRWGNAVYEVNDHWFRLYAKFVWKESPK